MTAKKKDESPIQKIIVGIIVTVASALILAYATGLFDSNTNTNPPPRPINNTQQEDVKPGEGRG